MHNTASIARWNKTKAPTFPTAPPKYLWTLPIEKKTNMVYYIGSGIFISILCERLIATEFHFGHKMCLTNISKTALCVLHNPKYSPWQCLPVIRLVPRNQIITMATGSNIWPLSSDQSDCHVKSIGYLSSQVMIETHELVIRELNIGTVIL